jgi:hypothetical protein
MHGTEGRLQIRYAQPEAENRSWSIEEILTPPWHPMRTNDSQFDNDLTYIWPEMRYVYHGIHFKSRIRLSCQSVLHQMLIQFQIAIGYATDRELFRYSLSSLCA